MQIQGSIKHSSSIEITLFIDLAISRRIEDYLYSI